MYKETVEAVGVLRFFINTIAKINIIVSYSNIKQFENLIRKSDKFMQSFSVMPNIQNLIRDAKYLERQATKIKISVVYQS
ncbi:hypothetical protein MNV_700020 [Candidatus Methanoperedens nitroreducens]|uniref:Uncharacterized protein n=1 Tax=Candidatus Methanoperedens nitratireducens TaxID=1392998 RepID=A0A284VSV6_9EURY|nr:hypothetical protein MNV_700020 [Candidatus Methanoperedens nitroreducens]